MNIEIFQIIQDVIEIIQGIELSLDQIDFYNAVIWLVIGLLFIELFRVVFKRNNKKSD